MPPHKFESPEPFEGRSDALKERNEEPLTSAEELLFEKYKTKYVQAQPDRQGLVYEPDHRAKVTKLEGKYADQTERALLLDRIMFTQKAWWGKNVEIYRSARFDDFENGIDLILEFLNDENERLGLLGLDTTVCNPGTLSKKLDKVAAKIDKGNLATLSYGPTLDGELGREHEEILDVPQAILVISAEGLELLSKELVGASSEEVSEHPIRLLFVDEVLQQLSRQKRRIEGNGSLPQERKDLLVGKLGQIIDLLTQAKLDMKTPSTNAKVWKDRMADYLIDDDLNRKIDSRQ